MISYTAISAEDVTEADQTLGEDSVKSSHSNSKSEVMGLGHRICIFCH